MTTDELKDKIRVIIKKYQDKPLLAPQATPEYDELVRFPELKRVLTDLLSPEYNSFITSLDWVAPMPTTFRINLQNNQEFYLIYGKRSWIAQVEGKKYYLVNIPEEQHAVEAIARILRYGAKEEPSTENDGFEDFETSAPPTSKSEPTPETPTEETPA
jgi:hypothetical protein